MDVIHISSEPPENHTPMLLAIGKFDGVHIGHQKILDTAKSMKGDAVLAVMSFWPHPDQILRPDSGDTHFLTPLPEKCRRLKAEGVQRHYVVEFSRDYAAVSAESFVHHHLSKLSLTGVVVGADFRFGQGGTADVHKLIELCGTENIPVYVVDPVEENGAKVSSSQIRQHLLAGRVEAAEVLLGRAYTLEGTVVHGDARGRQLGFPTANLRLEQPFVIPAGGVYAVSVAVLEGDNREAHWFGVLNAGTRPTVDGIEFRIEVHLLDFHGDLYDKMLRVSFLRRIRNEMKFENINALTLQIDSDVRLVRGFLHR